MHRLFNVCLRVFCAPNATILLVYIAAKIKMSFIIISSQWLVLGASTFQCMPAGFLCPKCDNFACLYTRQDKKELHLKIWLFFLPKSASSVSQSVVIFLSIVQAYTQPYSFGGRIKLIICQISHELNVTIHQISTLDGEPYIKHYFGKIKMLVISRRENLWTKISIQQISNGYVLVSKREKISWELKVIEKC